MSLQNVLNSILSVSCVRIPVRKLVSVCGKIISLTSCVGNVSRLMTRNLFAVINSASSWNSNVQLSSESLTEWNFWRSNVASLNGIPVWPENNQTVVRIVNCASRVPALQDLAMDIFQTCLLNGVSIDMQWIPRDINSEADDISKFTDRDDYTINDTIFNALDDLWGPNNCHRFACPYNAKVQCFNTRFYQPGSSGLNAFSQDWSHHNTGFVPRFIWRAKLSGTWIFSALSELSSFQSGSRLTFGHCFALMKFTGITLFMTWLFCPISLIYLLHVKQFHFWL